MSAPLGSGGVKRSKSDVKDPSQGYEHGVTEFNTYGAFADRMVAQVLQGLKADDPWATAEVQKDLKNGTEPGKRMRLYTQLHAIRKYQSANNSKKDMAGYRILAMRYILGADECLYLQCGLSALWTTAHTNVGKKDEALALAPHGLYAPETVGGIRAGVLRSLQKLNNRRKEGVKVTIVEVAAYMKGLLSVEEFKTVLDPTKEEKDSIDAIAEFKRGNSPLYNHVKNLSTFLTRFEALTKTTGDTIDTIMRDIMRASLDPSKLVEQRKLKTKVDELQAEVDTHKKDAQDAKAKLLDCSGKLVDCSGKLVDCSGKLAACTKELEELKVKCEAITTASKVLQTELGDVESNYEAEQKKSSGLKTSIETFTGIIKKLRADISELRSTHIARATVFEKLDELITRPIFRILSLSQCVYSLALKYPLLVS